MQGKKRGEISADERGNRQRCEGDACKPRGSPGHTSVLAEQTTFRMVQRALNSQALRLQFKK